MSDILYVVMPAYNEEENIEKSVRDWLSVLEGKDERSRLVVADSGSTDGTHDILVKMQKEIPQLMILGDTLKQHGPKLIALYNFAIEQGAGYVFQTDSDGQTNPLEFEAFWSERDKYDVILGWRRKRGDGKARLFVEKVLCLIIKAIFGVDIPDSNAPFRLLKAETLVKYMNRFSEDYNLPNVMLSVFLTYYEHEVLYKEITFQNRKAGKNSINISRIISIGLKSLGDFRKYAKMM